MQTNDRFKNVKDFDEKVCLARLIEPPFLAAVLAYDPI